MVDPQSDNSGNYGSVWTDFDNDRDLDLYIAKCRIGVNNPTDTRRINVLFENDGANNYAEAGEKYGLKNGHQSWTAEFQDIDNDGDMDCFITNHDYPCQILENDGTGRFKDITEQTGVNISGYFLQGIMRDFDNDGYVDIITSGPSHFFKNNGNKTFTPVFNSFTDSNAGSLTTGDLNHDGFIDIYTSYPNGINQFSGNPDKLFINQGVSGHNFIAVNLEGSQSNRMGIGARIEIHGSWGIQIREVRAGESYGISTSMTQHFGLGTETVIEQVIVRWPSGIVDVIQNPAPNQFLTVIENTSCQGDEQQLSFSGNTVICPGETVQISAPAGYTYFWNNGDTEQIITIDKPGNYNAILLDSNACVLTTNILAITASPDETPTLSIDGFTNLCDGDSVLISSSIADTYLWNTGDTSQSILVSTSGDYQVIINGVCDNWPSEIVTVDYFPFGNIPMVENDTIFAPGNAILEATGDNPYWYENEDDIDPIGIGNVFETPFIEDNTTFYVSEHSIYGGGKYETGMKYHQGSQYGSQFLNAEMYFDVDKEFILKSVKVYTDTYGIRTIQLMDQTGQVLDEAFVAVQSDTTILDLNFTISPGSNYTLTTDIATNLVHMGFASPRFKRSNQGVDYPYVVDDILSVTGSNGGFDFYYYFFDWQIEEVPLAVCPSDRIPVLAVIEPSNTFDPELINHFSIFPNPTEGNIHLEIESKIGGDATISLTDIYGKKVALNNLNVLKNQRHIESISLETLPKGVYILEFDQENVVTRKRIILQ